MNSNILPKLLLYTVPMIKLALQCQYQLAPCEWGYMLEILKIKKCDKIAYNCCFSAKHELLLA
jgi:hypothetical protein